MEIIQNVHHIPGVMANPYLVICPEGLTLVDTGLPGSQRRILRYIARLGYQPADLKRILITHADLDHVGGLAALKAASGAKVYAHPIEAEAIAAGRSSRELKPRNLLTRLTFRLTSQLVRVSPMQVDGFLNDGQELPELGGLRVLATPGHTPGHVSFFSESTGVLFSGDSIVSRGQALRGSQGANTWDQAKADSSLKTQAALGARIVCPGHGPVVLNAAGKIPTA
ncbi:MAG: MBL fold metallo-hydrolase [Anaerolineales bacterium]|jgi:glyoxylase-like metal-dependent hydrolase (beta-lactamase superfamily II)